MQSFRRAVERILEAVVIALMATLAVLVLVGVAFRAAGAALSWYDESAAILLCWLTYYGSALAALKRAHISVPGIVLMMPRPWRIAAFVAAEAIVLGFFALLTWIGWAVLVALQGDYLVSMPEVPVWVAQSIIPVGGFLIIVAELLSLPDAWAAHAATDTAAAIAATE